MADQENQSDSQEAHCSEINNQSDTSHDTSAKKRKLTETLENGTEDESEEKAAKPAQKERVASHPSLLPEPLVTKIKESKYVGLALLLTENKLDEDGNLSGAFEMVECAGEWKLKPKTKIHEIDSFDKWIRAFSIYMSIYLEAFPNKGVQMAKYIYHIMNGNNLYEWAAVYKYDINFRNLIEENPDKSWAEVEIELWEINVMIHQRSALVDCKEEKRVNNAKLYRYTAQEAEECRNYNSGFCTRFSCRYIHACMRCGKLGHPEINCWYLSD